MKKTVPCKGGCGRTGQEFNGKYWCASCTEMQIAEQALSRGTFTQWCDYRAKRCGGESR